MQQISKPPGSSFRKIYQQQRHMKEKFSVLLLARLEKWYQPHVKTSESNEKDVNLLLFPSANRYFLKQNKNTPNNQNLMIPLDIPDGTSKLKTENRNIKKNNSSNQSTHKPTNMYVLYPLSPPIFSA